MALLQLPPEILSEIFNLLSPSFFHEDLGRLTICKQWLEFARPICLKCITLSQEALRILIFSEDKNRLSAPREVLETLNLQLAAGFQDQSSISHLQKYPLQPNGLNVPASSEASTDGQLETCEVVLDHDITKLASIAQQSSRLRVLRIHASHSCFPEPFSNLHDYLPLHAMQNLLSVDNLSTLVLDLPIGLKLSSKERDDNCHICPAISAMLRTLKILHIRMRRICPDVLKPQDPGDSLRLSEVIVNLSLLEDIPGITSAAHSRRCGLPDVGMPELMADMRVQAESLADKMASPKTLRILRHSLPQFEVHSLDILSGETMILEDGMPWNADGKIVENSEPESDFDDDDFSSVSDE